jgi:hypothetical protein
MVQAFFSTLQFARHACAAAALIAVTLLGGCLDVENAIKFESNGGVQLTSRMAFDKEMDDVLAYVEYIARLSKNPEAATVSTGLCSAVSVAGAQAPPDIQLTSRQFVEQNRLVCEIRVRAKELSNEAQNLGGLDFFTIEDNASARQKTLRIDFEKLPDLSPFLMVGVMEQFKKSPDLAQNLSNREAFELLERTKKAFKAMTAMTLRNRYVELTVNGRILETDGQFSPDGKSAKLRLTYEELVDILLTPEARKGRKFSVVVAY